jgi:hypothetical protein
MTLTDQTFSLIKPFTGSVGSNGIAQVTVSHSIHGLIWQVYQLGFGLNEPATFAQAGAHMNGVPLSPAVLMQPVSFPGVPYALESFMVGPPYVGLKAGDQLVCSVINAKAGDTFTVGAFISEEDDPIQGPAAPSAAPPRYTRWR